MKALFFTLLCLIWGSTWLAIKIGLADCPPFTFAAIRFILATLVMCGILKYRHLSISRRWRDLRGAVCFGVFNGISYALVFWGEQYISSGLTSIINATLPFFSAVFAYFLVGERFTLAKGTGLAIGFGGVLLVFSRELGELGGANLYGQTAILLAAASYALGGTLAKRYQNRLGLLQEVTVQMGVTALVITPLLFLERGRSFVPDAGFVLALLYLVLVGSVAAFLLYFWLLERMEISRLSHSSLITPVIATLLGAWWAHEEVFWQYVAGLAVILLGVWIVNRPRADDQPVNRIRGPERGIAAAKQSNTFIKGR